MTKLLPILLLAFASEGNCRKSRRTFFLLPVLCTNCEVLKNVPAPFISVPRGIRKFVLCLCYAFYKYKCSMAAV